MKFQIDQALPAVGGRLGTITQTLINGKSITVQTPACTLYTKGGSAPYLGLNMLERIKNVPDVATMSVNAFVDHHDSIKQFGQGLKGFAAMKNSLIFSTLHDAGVEIPSGKNEKSGVAVWAKGGKMMLDPGLFVKIQESLQPDWLLALADGDTDLESGEKRAMKAVDRTLDFLDSLVAAREKSEVLKRSSLIGAVVGGFSERQRERSAKETSSRPVQGFLLEGFQKIGSESDIMNNKLFRDMVSQTLGHLPEDKPRIMESPWSPLQVVQAFKLGVDVFSSAYPHLLTEKGKALTADFSLSLTSSSENLEKDGVKSDSLNSVIDLNDKRYFEDFGPVLEGCQCYTCTTFTRSYIHHLLNTSELLAYVLLTIHNFERYFHFFHCLREAAHANKVDQLEKKLLQQNTVQTTETS